MTRIHLSSAAAVAATALVLAACGSSGSSGSGSSSTSASSMGGATASGTTAVKTAKTSVGTVVVDGSGRTLYLFQKDTGPKSMCSGSCAADWPPFTASAKPAATGVSGLTLVKRSDGKRQVVIDGHPLYFFSGDTSAGQLNGQAVDAFGAKWYVVAPTGQTITASAATSNTTSTRSGYGY